MDVQYRPKDWVEMKDGLDQITKDTFVKLFDANRLLADTQGEIQDLDEDRSINFHYKDQTEIIAKLREAYTTLGKFCDEAGQAVYDAIDKPFFVQMDQFAQKMRDVSIKNFETTNRIGFTTITTVQGSSGYGETAQTIKTTKNTITVDDIFKESYAFDEVLRADYEERKRQDPTLKLDYEEYRKHIPSTRGFEYLSIEDDQKKLETWRDFGIGVITIGGLFICPPLGIAAGTVFGILEVKSAYDGEDWETHRKLDKEERVVRGVFGGLDAMSGAGSLMKGAKGIGTLVKLPGDGTNFNPNVGKNMVQSLRDNNTLKNTLIPVGVSWMDTAGIGIKMPVVRFSKVGEIGEDFTKARVIAKDDPYQHIKGSGGSGVSSEGSVVKGTGEGSRIIPGTPGIVTGGNSTKLGKNMMTEMGLRRSTKWSGYQAQHIIPSEMADNPVIKKIGMNFDDSSNGIFLRVPDDNISTMARHRGYHSVYNEVVARALNKMDINQSIDSLQKQVYDLQKNLRKLQGNGLPLYPSQGATVELWERKLKQLEIQNK
ncbi:AHH domain-containing protein [Bacillus wiedmannii]|uniref:AHH domain-containing protein n=1 Tax=Bacillus wiedmannii TaxID=1890302 RepID=UPI00211D6817|nr:AHH domain-containing protein [Bacillus wiedmannii]